MTTPKLQREYDRLYPNEYNSENIYLPDPINNHTGRATFWRWYLTAIALVIVGCTLWAYYA
jgi:hypothetical protein